MQSLEKALHAVRWLAMMVFYKGFTLFVCFKDAKYSQLQPMPFTTGGQTITDRLIAAKHSLAGSQLGKTICKATTEELSAPKKKHLDCTFHFDL